MQGVNCGYVFDLIYYRYLAMVQTKKKQSTNRQRTYARNRASVSRRGYEKVFEADSTYFLKLVICVLLGTFWIKFGTPIAVGGLPVGALPVGLAVGLVLINKFEKIQSDRKIWYAVLIVMSVICYFVPAGIII